MKKRAQHIIVDLVATFAILLGIFIVGAIVYGFAQVIMGNLPQTVCLGY
jgi:hypothetical protein